MSEVLGKPVAELERTAALLTYKDARRMPSSKSGSAARTSRCCLAGSTWISSSFSLPTKRSSMTRARRIQREALGVLGWPIPQPKTLHFRNWLLEDQRRVDQVESSYVLASFVAPTFESAPLQIARWGSQIVLKPHQCAVVRRLVHHNGGLNAFDTGVGKTFSGIATMPSSVSAASVGVPSSWCQTRSSGSGIGTSCAVCRTIAWWSSARIAS